MKANEAKRRYTKSQIVVETCPICGKTYVPAPLHAYKMPYRNKRVCSYHCSMEAERRYEAGKKKPGRRKKQ